MRLKLWEILQISRVRSNIIPEILINSSIFLRRKKNLWFQSPTHRPYFFLPTLLFFQRDWPCDPIFSGWLRAAAKMVSVVTLIIEKTMKTIYISDLPTLIFTRYETGTTGIFFTPKIDFISNSLYIGYDGNCHQSLSKFLFGPHLFPPVRLCC